MKANHWRVLASSWMFLHIFYELLKDGHSISRRTSHWCWFVVPFFIVFPSVSFIIWHRHFLFYFFHLWTLSKHKLWFQLRLETGEPVPKVTVMCHDWRMLFLWNVTENEGKVHLNGERYMREPDGYEEKGDRLHFLKADRILQSYI